MKGFRAYYGCDGSGRRGIFECALCSGTGKVAGPPLRTHADSFRAGTLRTSDRPTGKPKRRPKITVRPRRRIVTEGKQ